MCFFFFWFKNFCSEITELNSNITIDDIEIKSASGYYVSINAYKQGTQIFNVSASKGQIIDVSDVDAVHVRCSCRYPGSGDYGYTTCYFTVS